MVRIVICLVKDISQVSRFGEDSVEKMVDWALDNATPEESGPSVLE